MTALQLFATPVLLTVLAIGLKATVLLAVAATLDRVVLRRRASAASLHLLWSFTVVALLLLPIAVAVMPRLRVPLPLIPLADRAAVGGASREPHAFGALASDESASAAAAPNPIAHSRTGSRIAAPVQSPLTSTSGDGRKPPRRSVPWAALLLGVYAAGVAFRLVRLAAERRVTRRLGRGTMQAVDASWTPLVRSVAGQLGIHRPVTLRYGAANAMPLTWGIRRPTVLLPSSANEWTDAQRRAVLLHELAHVARNDCLTQITAAVTCALYWPHAGAWWAERRLREYRELACDDRALLGGARARDYALLLLEIARTCRAPIGAQSLAVSMAATPSHLETRLRALIDHDRRRAKPGRRIHAVGAVLTTALLLPMAALRGARVDDPRPVPATRPMRSTSTPRQGPASAPPVSAAIPARAPAAAPTTPTSQGEWSIRLATPSESGIERPRVHLALRTPGLSTSYVALDDFHGLTPAMFSAATGPERFTLRRDAGLFTFAGSFRDGRGTGSFDFTPDRSFVERLVQRGLAAPTADQQFSLARHDMSVAFLDELASQGYARPSTTALVRAATSGADLEYLRALGALGYRLGTIDALVSASNNGVDPAEARALAALGYGTLAVDDLRRLDERSLTAAAIQRLNARVGRRLSVDELLHAMDGSEAAPAPAAAATSAPAATTTAGPASDDAGATPLSGQWVLSAKDAMTAQLELRWTDHTQWRRAIPLADLQGVTPAQIGAASSNASGFRIVQDAGRFEFDGAVGRGAGDGQFRFFPNRDFIAVMRALGVRDVRGVSDHTLKNLAFGGMSADAIREFAALGMTDLTLRDVTDLAVRSVSPAYVRALHASGVSGITVHDVTDLRFAGVPVTFAGDLYALGYRNLAARTLYELWRAGVTPSSVRASLNAVRPGERAPTIEELLERARQSRAAQR